MLSYSIKRGGKKKILNVSNKYLLARSYRPQISDLCSRQIHFFAFNRLFWAPSQEHFDEQDNLGFDRADGKEMVKKTNVGPRFQFHL